MIHFEAVCKHFGEGPSCVRALQEVNLVVPEHQMCALMGPSGAGKSTLLHTATGLTGIDSGQIRIGEREISKLDKNQLALLRRHEVGIVFQFFNLIPFLTSYENVALPLRLDAGAARNEHERVMEVLETVDLAARADHKPHQLSGGEMQRVALARALVIRPRVVLADEPTGNLDSHAARQVMQLLRDVNQQTGVTMVIVTHDPVWASLTDRVVRMVDGRITEDLGLSDDGDAGDDDGLHVFATP